MRKGRRRGNSTTVDGPENASCSEHGHAKNAVAGGVGKGVIAG